MEKGMENEGKQGQNIDQNIVSTSQTEIVGILGILGILGLGESRRV